MRISLLTILLSCAGTVFSYSSTAQNLTEVKANLPAGHLSLKEALRQLEKQTEIRFTYVSGDIQGQRKEQVGSQAGNVAEILEDLLENTGLLYEQMGKTVLIKKIPQSTGITANRRTGMTSAQSVIAGQVLDERGTPLRGVTVRIKGSHMATSTDQEGRFSLASEGRPVLVLSYVGYKNQEVVYSATSGESMRIMMEPDLGQLDAVAVIAYGTTSKRVSTGSTSGITSTVIAQSPINNPLEALQGRIAGLDISSNNGLPGASMSVRIRGLNSIVSGNEPLYIIDGIPYFSQSLNMFSGDNGAQSPLAGINPADIDRIDVLKDADATAIYGSRGANGVILITTKKGKAGKTQFNFNVYTGSGKATRMVEMLSTAEYISLREEAFRNSGIDPSPDLPDLFVWDRNLNQNWQEKLFGNTANLTEANLSLQGGSETTTYMLSGTMRQETTVQPGDNGYQKGSGMLTLNHRSPDGKFELSATANFTSDFNDALATDISQYYNLAPNMPVYNEDGSYYWYGNTQNPIAFLDRKHETRNKTLLTSGTVRYSPIRDLNLSATFGYNQATLNQLQMYPLTSFSPTSNSVSMAYQGNGGQNSYSFEPQANYTLRFGESSLELLAGATWQESIRDGNFFIGEDFTSDAQLNNIDAAVSVRSNGYRYSKYRYQAAFARATYNLENKYILNGTFRRDGSSRFGPDRRTGNFASIGAAWVFSEEDWAKNNGVLSFGKLRGSYGSTGNDQIGDYGFMDTWSYTSYPYNGVSGLYPTRVANPEYSWETTRKLEGGLELGFLNNRLTFNTNYYFNRSDNQLINRTLSPQTGFTGYTANLPGIVENKGWEFEVNSVNVKTRDFEWNTAANLTISRNKLVDYPGLEGTFEEQYYAIGYPMDIVYGYKFTGVDPQTGIAQFEDLSGDGELSNDLGDMYVMGTRLPEFFGGLSNNLTYKNFNLSFLLQFVKQEGEKLNFGYMAPTALGIMTNFDVSMRDRWRQPGDITDVPRAAATSADAAYSVYNTYYRHSDAQWGDASFIRLKNVMVSYDLSSLLSVLQSQKISIYAQGQNMLTFTNYEGFDPETRGRSTPPMKFYTFGLRFTY